MEISLFQGLERADALLFLTPPAKRRFTFNQRILEFFDWAVIVVTLAAFEQGGAALEAASQSHYLMHWFHMRYYKYVYGIDMQQSIHESWQSWEKRVSQQLGLEVTTISLHTASEQPAEASGCSYDIDIENLERDLKQCIVPKLLTVPSRRPLEMTQQAKNTFKCIETVAKELWKGLRVGICSYAIVVMMLITGAIVSIVFLGKNVIWVCVTVALLIVLLFLPTMGLFMGVYFKFVLKD